MMSGFGWNVPFFLNKQEKGQGWHLAFGEVQSCKENSCARSSLRVESRRCEAHVDFEVMWRRWLYHKYFENCDGDFWRCFENFSTLRRGFLRLCVGFEVMYTIFKVKCLTRHTNPTKTLDYHTELPISPLQIISTCRKTIKSSSHNRHRLTRTQSSPNFRSSPSPQFIPTSENLGHGDYYCGLLSLRRHSRHSEWGP